MDAVRQRPGGDRDPSFSLTILRWLVFNALLLGLLFVLLRGVFFGFGLGGPPAPPADPPPSVAYLLDAQVLSDRARGVGSVFPGTLRRLDVRRGQHVTRGQLLFRMDPSGVEERLRTARQGAARTGAAVTRAYAGREQALKPLRAEVAPLEARVRRQRALWHAAQARVRAARGSRSTMGSRPAGVPDRRAPGSTGRGAVHRAVGEMNRALARLKALKQEHAAARARLAAARRDWHERVVKALHDHRDARAGVEPLLALLEQRKQYSPIEGIVTSVRAAEGEWVAAGNPVVRVDDPSGFRLVALVREKVGESLREGLRVPVELGGPEKRRTGAEVVEIRPGWGRELFYSWLYLAPEDPALLTPHQVVRITLPGPGAPDAETLTSAAADERRREGER